MCFNALSEATVRGNSRPVLIPFLIVMVKPIKLKLSCCVSTILVFSLFKVKRRLLRTIFIPFSISSPLPWQALQYHRRISQVVHQVSPAPSPSSTMYPIHSGRCWQGGAIRFRPVVSPYHCPCTLSSHPNVLLQSVPSTTSLSTSRCSYLLSALLPVA
jgi:hypothetical protein